MNDYRFGNFICELRTEKGLSQSQLGDMLGVSNKAVSKWEMGVSKPRPDMLVTLATMFKVTVDELLAGERNTLLKKEERGESTDTAVKLWTGEYLKKKKRCKIAALSVLILPIVLFIWVGVAVELNFTDNVIAPAVATAIVFAEAIDIALIFVFYGSAKRLKRILYANYQEHAEEITAIIKPKKEEIPMLKREKICLIISNSIIAICYFARLIIKCLGATDVLRVFSIVAMVLIFSDIIISIAIVIHCYVRAGKIKKQK